VLRRETPEFTAADMWPPNSPHLNLDDYHICRVIQKQVYRTPSQDVADPRQRSMSVVDETVVKDIC